MPAVDHIEPAIDRALAFLDRSRSEDGLWRDFKTLAGTSSDWVTGFVTYAIGSHDAARRCVQESDRLLMRRQRPNGGWSYNRAVPTDCDSTAWSLLALSLAPAWRPSAIDRAAGYLRAHRHEATGGFSTYARRDGIDRFIEASSPALTQGWLAAHPCVTAVAIQSLLVHRAFTEPDELNQATSYLLTHREPAGIWRSYWWQGYGYPTYHVLRALIMARRLDPQTARESSAYVRAQQHPDGGWNDSDTGESQVFATAWLTLALLLMPNAETMAAAERGLSWLLDRQESDGRWPSAPILRIPPPMMLDPASLERWRVNDLGTGVVLADQNGIFTTAAALWALSVFRSMTPRSLSFPSAYITQPN